MVKEVAVQFVLLLSLLATAANVSADARYGSLGSVVSHRYVRTFPDSVCFEYILFRYGLFYPRAKRHKCGYSANLQTISCQPYCSAEELTMEIFAVHDQMCTNVHRVALTMNRITDSDQSDQLNLNTGSEITATFQTTERGWGRKNCPNSSYHIATLIPRMDQVWVCDGRQYVYNVLLYDDSGQPVTCHHDHIKFYSRAPL